MDKQCEKCKAWPSRRVWSCREAKCVGCGKAAILCPDCRNLYQACSPKCLAKYRAEIAAGLPKVKLAGPEGAVSKEPVGYAKFQAPLC